MNLSTTFLLLFTAAYAHTGDTNAQQPPQQQQQATTPQTQLHILPNLTKLLWAPRKERNLPFVLQEFIEIAEGRRMNINHTHESGHENRTATIEQTGGEKKSGKAVENIEEIEEDTPIDHKHTSESQNKSHKSSEKEGTPKAKRSTEKPIKKKSKAEKVKEEQEVEKILKDLEDLGMSSDDEAEMQRQLIKAKDEVKTDVKVAPNDFLNQVLGGNQDGDQSLDQMLQRVIEFMKPKTGEAWLEDLIESPSKQQTTTEIDLDTGDEETLDIVQAKLKIRTVAPPESPEVKAERAHAMWMAGFMYMNGLGTVNSERHPEKALVYYNMAFAYGSPWAASTLGYIHMAGHNVPMSCERSLPYFKSAADRKIKEDYSKLPRLGPFKHFPSIRLPDDEGGMYGPSASTLQSPYIPPEDLVSTELLQHFKSVQDYYQMAVVYYLGLNYVPISHTSAIHYFMKSLDDDQRANGMIGWMHLRGEGVKANNATAKHFFEEGAARNDALSLGCLGIMLIDEGKEEVGRKYLERSVAKGWAEAQVQMGLYYLNGPKVDLIKAAQYFAQAISKDHILGIYHLAEMNFYALNMPHNCEMANRLYKSVTEKGLDKLDLINLADQAWTDEKEDEAYIRFMMAAEQGREDAQVNLGWMIDQGGYKLPQDYLPNLLPSSETTQAIKRNITATANDTNTLVHNQVAYLYYHRSANQNGVDSRNRCGDFHFDGRLGADSSPALAAEFYKTAVAKRSAVAAYNVGWMYEYGVGLPQDLHMAKRSYDQCEEFGNESVGWVLMIVRLRLLWKTHGILGLLGFASDDTGSTNDSTTTAADKKKDLELDIPEPEEDLDDLFGGEGGHETNLLVFIAIAMGFLYFARRRENRLGDRDRVDPFVDIHPPEAEPLIGPNPNGDGH